MEIMFKTPHMRKELSRDMTLFEFPYAIAFPETSYTRDRSHEGKIVVEMSHTLVGTLGYSDPTLKKVAFGYVLEKRNELPWEAQPQPLRLDSSHKNALLRLNLEIIPDPDGCSCSIQRSKPPIGFVQ